MARSLRRWALRLLVIALIPPAFVGIAALFNDRVEADTRFDRSALRARELPPLAQPVTLRLVTFNVAAGYLFTNNRPERMRAIAAVLRELDPDLVGLQEAFIEADRDLLWSELRGSRLAHQVRFPGATVGNGLWILSAHPIREAWFHRYGHAGRWWRLWEGDWWAGKGIGLARVEIPEVGFVDFFDTHAQAGRGNPENETVRLGQMEELARFVGEARLPTAPAFVVGDFNTRPGNPDYELAVREARLVRAMSLDSRIDHIFAIGDPRYRFEVEDTRVIAGETQGSGPGIFLSRAPTFRELLAMVFGGPGPTPLSDHPGYVAQVRVVPLAP
jgi:endonuclease/exonuclease/phosphatase family metal-dependent hydrolase